MIGRPKSYKEDDVLDAVMDVFWNQGFASTSYDDLVRATGLGRQSLYNGFGDKQELFSRSLSHYTQKVTSQSIGILRSSGAPLENISRWLSRLTDRVVQHRRGCLLTNSAVELPQGESTGKIVLGELDLVEQALFSAIQSAIERQELKTETEAGKLSVFLLGVAQGVMVLGRAGASKERLEAISDSAIDHLLQFSVQSV